MAASMIHCLLWLFVGAKDEPTNPWRNFKVLIVSYIPMLLSYGQPFIRTQVVRRQLYLNSNVVVNHRLGIIQVAALEV